MNIFRSTKKNIARAADLLRQGGIVAFPTETVYGLGAMVSMPKGVARIFEAKKRPFFDPLIVHILSLDQLKDLIPDYPPSLDQLLQRFWPGPLTIVSTKKESVPDIVTAGLDTVAVRMPRHPVSRYLIDAAGGPIAAPSANLFGSASPTEAGHVWDQLGDAVDMILDGGRCEVGIESTIIKIDHSRYTLLRPGGIPLEELQEELGIIALDSDSAQVEAPGQLPYHYSPSTPVTIVPLITSVHRKMTDAVFLYFKKPEIPVDPGNSFILSPSGDLREAASNLFSHLHCLDKLAARVIIAEEVPLHGLGRAIMDRLIKASRKPAGV